MKKWHVYLGLAVILTVAGLFGGMVSWMFQLGLKNAFVLIVFGLVYAAVTGAFYAASQKMGSGTLKTVGNVLTLIGIFVGWCYLGPVWAHTYAIQMEMGWVGRVLLYGCVLIGGPAALGVWLTITLSKPPRIIVAFVILAICVVVIGAYQGFRTSGLRDPLTREPIFAFCPGDEGVEAESGELPWETTHFVSLAALGKGDLFHTFVMEGAIVEYEESNPRHRRMGEYLENVVGLRLGDDQATMARKRLQAASRSREWLKRVDPSAVSADDDDSGAAAGGFGTSLSALVDAANTSTVDSPFSVFRGMQPWMRTVLVIVLGSLLLTVVLSLGIFRKPFEGLLLVICVLGFVAAYLLLGHVLKQSAGYYFASEREFPLRMHLSYGDTPSLGYVDYQVRGPHDWIYVAYDGDPACSDERASNGFCRNEVCLQVRHGSSPNWRVVLSPTGDSERWCLGAGDVALLSTSGTGRGTMDVHVQSGGGDVTFGPAEAVHRVLLDRLMQANATRSYATFGQRRAVVHAGCVAGAAAPAPGETRVGCGRYSPPPGIPSAP